MKVPPIENSVRRVSRHLVECGLSHEEAAAYLAALINAGPLSPGLPPSIAAAFSAGLPAWSNQIRAMLDTAGEIVDVVELDHVVGRN